MTSKKTAVSEIEIVLETKDCISPLSHPGVELSRQLIEEAPFPIFVSSMEDRSLLYVNNAAISYIGKTPLPVESGQKCYEYIRGRDQICEKCSRFELIKGKAKRTLFVGEGAHGNTVALHSMMADWNGIPAHVEYLTDIHSIVSGNRAVRDSAIRETSDQIPAGVATYRVFTDHVEIIYANTRLRELMGIVSEDITEADIFKRVSEEDSRNLLNSVLTYAYSDTLSDMHFHVRIQMGDGTVRSFSCRGAAVRIDGTEPIYRLVVMDTEFRADGSSMTGAVLENVLLAGSGSDSVFWLYDIEGKKLTILGMDNPDVTPFTPPHTYYNVPESIVSSGFIHVDDISKYLRAYQDIREGKKIAVWTMQLRTFMKDTSFCKVRCKLVRFTDPVSGRPMAVGSMAKYGDGADIALQSLVADPPNAHILALDEGKVRVKKYMPSTARLAGFPDGKLPAKYENNFLNLIAKEDRSAFLSYIERVLAAENEALSIDYRIVRPDGSVLTINDTAIAINDPELGRIIYVSGTVADRSDGDKQMVVNDHMLSKALLTINTHFVIVNITKNHYAFKKTSTRLYIAPEEGDFDKAFDLVMQRVPLDQRSAFINTFSRSALYKAYNNGKESVYLKHDFVDANNRTLVMSSSAAFFTDERYPEDVSCFVLTRDVTDEAQERERLQTDGLTGLMYRSIFEDMVAYRLEKYFGMRSVFIVVDMDKLKDINDTGGHLEGDKALAHLAKCMREVMPKDAILGRMGGDEFGVFMCPAPTREEIDEIAAQLMEAVSTHTLVKLGGAPLTCSVGCFIAFARKGGLNEMQSRADAALYDVKNSGRNNYRIIDG